MCHEQKISFPSLQRWLDSFLNKHWLIGTLTRYQCSERLHRSTQRMYWQCLMMPRSQNKQNYGGVGWEGECWRGGEQSSISTGSDKPSRTCEIEKTLTSSTNPSIFIVSQYLHLILTSSNVHLNNSFKRRNNIAFCNKLFEFQQTSFL